MSGLKMNRDNELISLLLLADDPDRIVSETVKEKLVERGEEAIAKIEGIVGEGAIDRLNTTFINDLLVELKEEAVKKRLVQLLQLPEPPLGKMLFYLTKLADTNIEESIWSASEQHFLVELSMEISGERTPVEEVEIFNHIFFRRFGFSYGDTRMQTEEYALLDRVIRSKTGNPISIALVYLLLARNAGLPLFPCCFTGGFVPAYEGKNGETLFYVDIFDEMAIFPRRSRERSLANVSIDNSWRSSTIGCERALGAIYIEMLLFVFGKSGFLNRKVGILESTMKLFGEKRYL